MKNLITTSRAFVGVLHQQTRAFVGVLLALVGVACEVMRVAHQQAR